MNLENVKQKFLKIRENPEITYFLAVVPVLLPVFLCFFFLQPGSTTILSLRVFHDYPNPEASGATVPIVFNPYYTLRVLRMLMHSSTPEILI